MTLATRYALLGIAALALLETVHWIRSERWPLASLDTELIGIAPNFLAAVAICFVLLSILTGSAANGSLPAARSGFMLSATVSGIGLTTWELAQRSIRGFVFDTADLWATLAGLLFAALLFLAVTPKGIR